MFYDYAYDYYYFSDKFNSNIDDDSEVGAYSGNSSGGDDSSYDNGSNISRSVESDDDDGEEEDEEIDELQSSSKVDFDSIRKDSSISSSSRSKYDGMEIWNLVAHNVWCVLWLHYFASYYNILF